jgi:hypothetical protein
MTTEWLESHIAGARLIGLKCYTVKADWIKVPLAINMNSGNFSNLVMERFGMENRV